MQGTWVRSLVREDPTCRRATKSTSHNYWAHVLQLLKPAHCNYWSPRAQSPCSATREATIMRSPRTATKSSPQSPQLEKTLAQQPRPNAAKNKIKIKKKKTRNISDLTDLSYYLKNFKKIKARGFPGGAVVESLPANAGDTGPSPGLGGSHMLRSN